MFVPGGYQLFISDLKEIPLNHELMWIEISYFFFLHVSFWTAKDESGITNVAELDQNLPVRTPYWLRQDNTQKVKLDIYVFYAEFVFVNKLNVP
jgi:hypothetical protein